MEGFVAEAKECCVRICGFQTDHPIFSAHRRWEGVKQAGRPVWRLLQAGEFRLYFGGRLHRA